MLALLVVLVGGCDHEHPPFVCHADSNCDRNLGGEPGHCWAAPTGYDTCAYRDTECPSSWRWDDLEALTDCIAPEHVCAALEPNACN